MTSANQDSIHLAHPIEFTALSGVGLISAEPYPQPFLTDPAFDLTANRPYRFYQNELSHCSLRSNRSLVRRLNLAVHATVHTGFIQHLSIGFH